jgi:hypothetical protein
MRAPVVMLIDDSDRLGPTARHVLREAAGRERVSLVLGQHGSADQETAQSDTTIALGPLSRDGIAQMAMAYRGTPPSAEDIERLITRTGGNPLLLQIIIQNPGTGHDGTSDRMVAMVHSMLAKLTPDQRTFAQRASVAGPGFPLALLGNIRELPDTLMIAGAGVEFRHDALRETIYHELPPAYREEIHAELGLAARAASASPSIAARHLLDAGPLAPVAQTQQAAQEAAAESARLGAHGDAVAWLRDALTLKGLDSHTRLELGIELGDEQRLAGDPEHLRTLNDAVSRALSISDERAVSHGCFALLQLGGTTAAGSQSPETSQLIERALAALKAPHLRAPVCGAASLAWSLTGDAQRASAYFAEAEQLAVGDADRAKVLPFAYMAMGMPGDLPKRRRFAGELRELAEKLDDPVARFESRSLNTLCV